MKSNARWSHGIFAIGFVLALASGSGAPACDETGKPTITVTGHGEIEVPPDQAVVRLIVSGRDENVADARRKLADKLTKVLTALKDAGLSDESIKRSPPVASMFQSQPTFSVQGGMQQSSAQRILGVNLTLAINEPDLPQLEKVWKVIDAALEAGAEIEAPANDFNPYNKPASFTQLVVQDPTAAREQATRKAAEDAARRGKLVAEGLGRKLGPILSANEGGCGSSDSNPIRFIYQDGAPAPDNVNTVKITSDVTVKYTLE